MLGSDGREFFFASGWSAEPNFIYRGFWKDDGVGDTGTERLIDISGQFFEGTEPAISPDGHTLYLTKNDDIYTATRATRSDPFNAPELLLAVTTDSAEGSPFVTADGKTLYFESDRYQEDYDLFTLALDVKGAKPVPVRGLNTKDIHEMSPILTRDERTIYFASSEGNDNKRKDIWMAQRLAKTESFGTPTPLFSDFDTKLDNRYPQTLTADGCTLYYDKGYRLSGSVWAISKVRP